MLDLLRQHLFEGIADSVDGRDGHDVAGRCVADRAVVGPPSFSKEIAASDYPDASTLVIYHRIGAVSVRSEALRYLSDRGAHVDAV